MVIPLSDSHIAFEISESFAGSFDLYIYFIIKGSISRESTAKVGKRINHIQYCTLDEDDWFNMELAWRWREHDLCLLLAEGKSKSGACSGEDIMDMEESLWHNG